MKQAGTWDPLLQYCRACTWTHLSSSNKIQINCMGLKITVYMPSWGKIMDKKRDQKTQLPLLKGLEQTQGSAHAPWTKHHKGVGKSLKPPLWPYPWTHPYPHPHIRNKLAPPWGSKQAREPVVCSHSPPCCSRGPNKALPGKKKVTIFLEREGIF